MNSGPSEALRRAKVALNRVEEASLTNAAYAGKEFAKAVFDWMVEQERRRDGQ